MFINTPNLFNTKDKVLQHNIKTDGIKIFYSIYSNLNKHSVRKGTNKQLSIPKLTKFHLLLPSFLSGSILVRQVQHKLFVKKHNIPTKNAIVNIKITPKIECFLRKNLILSFKRKRNNNNGKNTKNFI